MNAYLKRRLPVTLFFGGGGIAHLTFARGFFESIVPPWVPGSARDVNVAAGVAELTGAALAATPGAERIARPYLVALLLAVFPSNCHMAIRPQDLPGAKGVPRWALWARLPLQFLMIWWVWTALHPEAEPGHVSAPTPAS